MDFGEVLTKAGKIIWKHKVLWIFGILASCGTRSGGGGGSGAGGGGNGNNNFPGGSDFFNQLGRFIENLPAWVWILVAAAGLVFVLLALFLGTIGRIGLVKGTLLADDGAERLSLGGLFNESLPYFGRVFVLNLVIFIVSAVLFLVLLVPFVGLTALTMGIGLLCLIPLICLLVPVFWLVSIIVEQANVAVVAENLGVIAALERAWQVFKSNLGALIIIGLILAIGGGILGFLIGLPFIAIVVPVIMGTMSDTQTGMNTGLAVAGVLFLIYLPVAIALSGILQSYIGAAWTLTYRRLTAPRQTGTPPLPVPAAAPEPPAPTEPPRSDDPVI